MFNSRCLVKRPSRQRGSLPCNWLSCASSGEILCFLRWDFQVGCWQHRRFQLASSSFFLTSSHFSLEFWWHNLLFQWPHLLFLAVSKVLHKSDKTCDRANGWVKDIVLFWRANICSLWKDDLYTLLFKPLWPWCECIKKKHKTTIKKKWRQDKGRIVPIFI